MQQLREMENKTLVAVAVGAGLAWWFLRSHHHRPAQAQAGQLAPLPLPNMTAVIAQPMGPTAGAVVTAPGPIFSAFQLLRDCPPGQALLPTSRQPGAPLVCRPFVGGRAVGTPL